MTPEHTALVARLETILKDGCSSCDFDEAEGLLLNHCDECRRRITTHAYDLFIEQKFAAAIRALAVEVERLKILCESGGTKLLTMMLERDTLRAEVAALREQVTGLSQYAPDWYLKSLTGESS